MSISPSALRRFYPLPCGAGRPWRVERVAAATISAARHDRIIADNYASVVAAQQMKESLERQDSAALFTLIGEAERGRAQLREHRARFDAALDRAAGNITEPGEREVVDDIRAMRTRYYRAFDLTIASGRAAPTREYFARSSSRCSIDCARRVDDLLQLNQEAMRGKSAAAEEVARRWYFTSTLIARGAPHRHEPDRRDRAGPTHRRPLKALTAATERIAPGRPRRHCAGAEPSPPSSAIWRSRSTAWPISCASCAARIRGACAPRNSWPSRPSTRSTTRSS